MGKMHLEVCHDEDDEGDVAYLQLPAHIGDGQKVDKTIRLLDLLEDYKGPDLFLDFDKDGVLIGVEILC